ncbi:hypothetical protein KUTeg_014727 [Tegillarca granosa]|uniref:Sulfatase N-terminal domain-containing protein n=1 Tax=Tegillarca granosa TaxID=220873 RepID=A0ABQ9EVW9_TEGGR|nr:hypothetical protein KUTeg_014727 [Tegillarca granosa]
MWLLFHALIIQLCTYFGLISGKPPNILFIVADDLGWNDVGFHNPDIISPNIDRLAKEGVILNQSYVQPVCSPSRNAFMSGIYPFKAGLQYLYTRRAQQLIEEHDKNQPLFLYMAFQSVHSPIQNGGWPTFYGNNYPLRGSKITVYEGGTRASAFIHGSMLKNRGYTYDGLIHAVDWMPTIISAAGGTPATDIDGVDQWSAIVDGSQSKRNEFIYNLDNMFPAVTGHAAIRSGDYKLIDGFPGPYPFWYKPQQYEKDDPIKKCHLSHGQHRLKDYNYNYNAYEPYEFQKYENEEITGMCNETFGFYQLFNIKDDPNEYYNLAFWEPHKVIELKKKLDIYRKTMVPANFPKNDPNSLPKNFDGYWSPGWC